MNSCCELINKRLKIFLSQWLDVAEEINREEATGNWQILTGNIGDWNTEDLVIRYKGHSLPRDSHSSNISIRSYLEQT